MCKYKDTNLGITKLSFTEKRGKMAVYMTDGREVIVPVTAFPDIKALTMKQRNEWYVLDEQFFTFDHLTTVYSIKDVLNYMPLATA